MERGTARRSAPLGVVDRGPESRRRAGGGEHDRRRDHRPRPGAAPGLVDPGHAPARRAFERKVRPVPRPAPLYHAAF